MGAFPFKLTKQKANEVPKSRTIVERKIVNSRTFRLAIIISFGGSFISNPLVFVSQRVTRTITYTAEQRA